MKHNLVERVLVGILLVVAGGIVLHAPLSVWLGTAVWPDGAQYIKAWKEVLMGVALVLLIVTAARRKKLNELLEDRLMQLSLVFAGLHFVMMSVFGLLERVGLPHAGAGLLIDLRFVLYFVLVYGTIRLLPQYKKVFLWVFGIGAVVVMSFALLQVFVLPRDALSHIGYSRDTIAPYLLVDDNPALVRINSTLRGPNPLGAYAVIVLAIVAAIAIKCKLRWRDWLLIGVAALAGGVTLGVSYSRSSLIGAAVALAIVAIVPLTARLRRRVGLSLAAAALVLGGLTLVFRDSYFVTNVILHDNPTTGAQIDSNTAHVDSLIDGTERMIRQPFGAGVGSTGSASLGSGNSLIIENHYLFVAHEVGWAGLALFVWLFVEVMRRLWQRRSDVLTLGVFASGVGLAIIGLFLPVWVDDTVSVVWWGLAGLVAGREVSDKKKNRGRKKHGA